MSPVTSTHSIRREINETLAISIPLISSQLIYACSSFVGTAMVAQLGEDALAASILVSMIWWTASVLFFGILNSISVLVAHQFGARNHSTISAIMGQAFLLGVIVCLLLLLTLLSLPFFLQFTAQPEVVIKLANEYLFSLLWTIPGLVILVIGEQFLAGVNRPKIVLRISLAVVPIEIAIIYVLIFGKFGLPTCGIAGVGYGFAITYTLSAIWMIYYLQTSKQYKPYAVFASVCKFNWHYCKDLIIVGMPMGLMHTIELSTFAVATLWIGQFGTTMLAGHQIVMQYLGFAITIVFAMSQAVTVRVGHAVGRQDLTEVNYASYVGLIMNIIVVFFIALAFYLFPTFFLRLDVDIHHPTTQALVHDASMLLGICGVLLFFDNIRVVGFGALRGLKDANFPMYASFIGFWLIGLSTAYALGFHFDYAAQGIWWGLTLGIASSALIVIIRLQRLLQRVDLAALMR